MDTRISVVPTFRTPSPFVSLFINTPLSNTFSWTPSSKCDILITEMEDFMSRKIFTEEQQQLLRQNPYIYSVTDTRINLTKEFKEIFLAEYKSGTSPRKILEDHGFDISIIGERRIWSISNHIRTEYKSTANFTKATGLVVYQLLMLPMTPVQKQLRC